MNLRVEKLMRLTEKSYFFSVIILSGFLPFSKAIVSVFSLITLLLSVAIFLFSKKMATCLFFGKTTLTTIGLFLLFLISSFFVNFDKESFISLLRNQVFFLILPIALSQISLLSESKIYKIHFFFVFSILVSLIVITINYHKNSIGNVRSASIFISHIRLALMVVVSIFIVEYHKIRMASYSFKLIGLVYQVSAFSFLIYFSMMTGVITLLVAFIMDRIFKFYLKNKYFKALIFSFVSIILSISSVIFLFFHTKHSFSVNYPTPLETKTALGSYYQTDTVQVRKFLTENNRLVYDKFNREELHKAWREKSAIPIAFEDYQEATLLRYLTSKGYSKDYEGVNRLSQEDIYAIEKGVTNYKLLGSLPITKRLYNIEWELNNFLNGGLIDNHSITQRIAYLKAALHIIKENLFIGVGFTQQQKAYEEYYKKNNIRLSIENRRKAHNQYISYCVSGGILGFFCFLVIIYFLIKENQLKTNYLFLIFVSVYFVSMFWEDTLDSQVGITSFIFFLKLFEKRKTILG